MEKKRFTYFASPMGESDPRPMYQIMDRNIATSHRLPGERWPRANLFFDRDDAQLEVDRLNAESEAQESLS